MRTTTAAQKLSDHRRSLFLRWLVDEKSMFELSLESGLPMPKIENRIRVGVESMKQDRSLGRKNVHEIRAWAGDATLRFADLWHVPPGTEEPKRKKRTK